MTNAPVFATRVGRGPCHFLLLPGLVPDGPETFLRQRHLFLAYGTVTTVTYAYDAFDLDTLIEAIERHIVAASAAGQPPVLVGVSVGGGVCLELLRRCRVAGRELPLAGLILVSPLTCTEDLAPMLRRMLDPIFEGDEVEVALARGRSLFKSLVQRSAPGTVAGHGLMGLMASLTPAGLRARRETAIRVRIERTLDAICGQGALERVISLRGFVGLGGKAEVLHRSPTLILWGSKERQTLRMDGPGTGVLCRPDLACRYFPDVQVHWIYSADGDDVPHASLLKHAHAFNPHLKRFIKLLAPLDWRRPIQAMWRASTGSF